MGVATVFGASAARSRSGRHYDRLGSLPNEEVAHALVSCDDDARHAVIGIVHTSDHCRRDSSACRPLRAAVLSVAVPGDIRRR